MCVCVDGADSKVHRDPVGSSQQTNKANEPAGEAGPRGCFCSQVDSLNEIMLWVSF